MTNITPSTARIQEEAVDFRSPASESVGFAIGGAVNYLLDTTDTQTINIATNAADIATLEDNIYLRGTAYTESVLYNLTDPFGETLIATLIISGKANPLGQAKFRMDYGFNQAYATASYTLGPSFATAVTYSTRFRVSYTIGASAETNVIDITNNGAVSSGAPPQTGTFLGSWNYLDGNFSVHQFNLLADDTVTFRVYVDFNRLTGAAFGATFQANALNMCLTQLR